MSHLFVRDAHVTEAFAAFMFFARTDEFASCSTVSLALSERLLISNSPLMIGETGLAPKSMSQSAQGI